MVFVVPLGVTSSHNGEHTKTMLAILPLLLCLQPELSLTTLRRFSRIGLAMLAMTGRVTMLGISRWTADGGSYRTVQRFCTTVIPWAVVFWHFFRVHLFSPSDVYLLAGDETVVTKAGKQTYGLDRFFAGLYGKPMAGLAFFTLSLISIQQRRSFPIHVEQVVHSADEKKATRAQTRTPTVFEPLPKRKPGRPKGSTTKAKTAVVLSPELTRIQTLIRNLLRLIDKLIPLTYLVLDGHFGNAPSLQMAQQCKLHLISKLRSDSALFLPDDRPYTGRGPRRIYGDKLDVRAIPKRFLRQTSSDGSGETCIYQLQARHRTFAQALNVVCIVKTNRKTQRCAHVLLFSSDLALPYELLIDYYALRFQLEFNFRDAKQYWGLEDFMNTSPIAVTNAANLSLFMVNLVERLLRDVRQADPLCSVQDLKARCRGAKYVEEIIKRLPQKPEPVLFTQILAEVVGLGRIHPLQPDPIPI